MLRCNRGVSVSACLGIQPRLKAAGFKPYYCHDCRADDVIPRLVMEADTETCKSILSDLAGTEVVSEAVSQQIRPWLGIVRCRRTQLPVVARCKETGCSSWIERKSSNNCNMVDAELRPKVNGIPSLTISQSAVLYGDRGKEEVYADYRVCRFFMTALMLPVREDVPTMSAGDRPGWVADFETRFSVSIGAMMRHVDLEDLKAALSVTDDDLAQARTLSDYE